MATLAGLPDVTTTCFSTLSEMEVLVAVITKIFKTEVVQPDIQMIRPLTINYEPTCILLVGMEQVIPK